MLPPADSCYSGSLGWKCAFLIVRSSVFHFTHLQFWKPLSFIGVLVAAGQCRRSSTVADGQRLGVVGVSLKCERANKMQYNGENERNRAAEIGLSFSASFVIYLDVPNNDVSPSGLMFYSTSKKSSFSSISKDRCPKNYRKIFRRSRIGGVTLWEEGTL